MESNYASLKETLTKLLNSNDTVFIISHDRPDFDALGSTIGMAFICEKMKKTPYIVINDELNNVDKSISIVINDMKSRFNVIKADEVDKVKRGRNLLIVLDTNKEYMISVNSDDFDEVIVIDHHSEDERSIKNAHKFINTELSSACEIVEGLMNQFHAKYNPKEFASYLLAGIKLDTKGYDKNATFKTHEAISRLIKSGANPTYVNELFLEDFAKDRIIQKLVEETKIYDFSVAIACQNSNLDIYYTREDLAKAADYLLKFNINASFVIGKIDENDLYISARSKGLINVGNIMSKFGNGGGNLYSAAAKVDASISLKELEETLMNYLTPGYIEEENIKVRKLKL